MKRFFVLLLVLLAIFLFFEAGLYIAGLAPQERILESIQDSLAQLEAEYEKPYVLHNRNRNGIDNFTDCLMLNLSYFMNTNSEPSSILGNPLYWEDNLEPFEEFKLLSSSQIANGNYLNYCMGYRLYLRPMLSLLNYMEIRNAFIFITWMLFGLSLITVSLVTKNNWFAVLYTLCIVSLNPVAISGSITLMTCFIIAFIGVLLIPYVHAIRWRLGIPILFLFLGALTQFFDFYTYPMITFIAVLIIWLVLFIQNKDRNAMIRENWVFLAVGAISLLWIVFAKRIHRFFQYRILGVFMMGFSLSQHKLCVEGRAPTFRNRTANGEPR